MFAAFFYFSAGLLMSTFCVFLVVAIYSYFALPAELRVNPTPKCQGCKCTLKN